MIKKFILVSFFMACLALSYSSFAFGINADAKAGDYYRKGSALYEQGKYKKANELFAKALTILEKDKANAAKEAAAAEKIAEQKPVLNFLLNIPVKSDQERQIDEAFEMAKPVGNYPEYIIGIGDILSVFIWQNQDLTQDVIVRPDGRISFPLVGDMSVVGRTLPDVGKDLKERLREYIKYPEVSLSIRQFGGGKVIVLGEVKQPGVYFVTGRKTVLEAIALANGFTDASLASTVVVVKGIFSGHPKVVRVSSNMALKGSLINNIMLESEDVVFVPKKPISDANWFLENVVDPAMREITVFKTFMKMDK